MRPAEEQKLRIAISTLKSGDQVAAMELFMDVLRENPTLEDAWVGLSLCAKTVEQRKSCLNHALSINPDHPYARSALARIEQGQESPQTSIVQPAQTKKSWTGNQIFAAFLGIMLCVVCVFGSLILFQNYQQSPDVVVAKGKLQFIEFYADW